MKKEKYDLKEQKKTQKLNPGPFYPKKKKLIIIWNLWTSFEVLIYRFERGISWGQDLLDHLFFFSEEILARQLIPRTTYSVMAREDLMSIESRAIMIQTNKDKSK